jgi:hypothetical protein
MKHVFTYWYSHREEDRWIWFPLMKHIQRAAYQGGHILGTDHLSTTGHGLPFRIGVGNGGFWCPVWSCMSA